MFGRARFVPLSPACQRPKLVPVICNASNIYCRGLLGIDRADTVTGKTDERGEQSLLKEGENDRSSESDGMMEKERGERPETLLTSLTGR